MRKRLLYLLIITLAIVLTIYVPISFYPLNKAVIAAAEERLDAKISCRSLKIYLWRSVVARGVEAVGKGGFIVTADNTTIDYDLISLLTGRLHLKCSMENVKFPKASSIMNSLTDLLQIGRLSERPFHTVRGDFYVGRDDTLTQNLALLSDDLKILANACTDRDDNINSSVYFFLNEKIVSGIPRQVREGLLRKVDGPWYSIDIGIMGNYERPALRIMTEHFKMNITVGRSG
jgi:hypothetical protein